MIFLIIQMLKQHILEYRQVIRMKEYNKETTFTAFDKACKKYPNNDALIYIGDKFTYSDLAGLVNKFASGLYNLGVRPDDKVMLYIPNCPQWIIANFGINKIGAVVVPVSPIYTSFEIEYIANDAEVETIICLDTNYSYVKEILPKTKVKRVIITSIVELIAPWKKAMGHLFDVIPKGKIEKADHIFTFKDVLKKGKSSPPPPEVEIDPFKDLSYIMYTGGTTGFPKGVPGNHMGEVSYIEDVVSDVMAGHIQEGTDKIIMINPLFHIMAKGYTIGLGLNLGNTVILMPAPQVDSILYSVQKYKIRWMLGVPTLYRMMLDNDRLDQYDLSTLRYCYCGGDVLPTEIFNKWKDKNNVPIYQVYGSTEVGHVSYSTLKNEPSLKAVGIPLKSRKCLIISAETLKPQPVGEVGELAVSSPYTIKNYWNKPEETAASFINIDGETYYRMGDFMKINENGELEFIERTADIIKCKGYRVSASEIEAVLQDNHAVIGACVIGVPDPKIGERIKAIVVLKHDIKGVGSTELLAWCRERLASYKIPSYIEFRDMLPKSKVGKLLRREIRDEEVRKREKKKQANNQ